MNTLRSVGAPLIFVFLVIAIDGPRWTAPWLSAYLIVAGATGLFVLWQLPFPPTTDVYVICVVVWPLFWLAFFVCFLVDIRWRLRVWWLRRRLDRLEAKHSRVRRRYERGR